MQKYKNYILRENFTWIFHVNIIKKHGFNFKVFS